MGAKNDVFARSEKKYLITPEQYARFFKTIGGHLVPAEYGEGIIRSLYYDTPQDEMINRSLEKPLYKEKLRLRAYEIPREDSPVYIEIKKKFKGIVYKRRICVSLAAARAIMDKANYLDAIERYPLAAAELQKNCFETTSFQIAAEISYLVNRYENLHPAMLITVDRNSWVSTEDNDLRITYDSSITWTDSVVSLDSEDTGVKLFNNGERILEIKCAAGYPRWLIDALNKGQIYPCSISKYGRAYQAAHEQGTASVPATLREAFPSAEPFATPYFRNIPQRHRTGAPAAQRLLQPAYTAATAYAGGAPAAAAIPSAGATTLVPNRSHGGKLAHAKHAAVKEGAYCA